MKSRNYYNVYQGRKAILKHATRAELREKLGIKNPMCYVDGGYKAFGIYSIHVCDKDMDNTKVKLSEEQEKKYQKVRTRFTRKSFLEWEEMNRRYGTVVH